jgi:hypothetical protein
MALKKLAFGTLGKGGMEQKMSPVAQGSSLLSTYADFSFDGYFTTIALLRTRARSSSRAKAGPWKSIAPVESQ